MSISIRNCLQSSTKPIHQYLCELIQNLPTLPSSIFKLHIILVMPEQSHEKSLMKRIAFKVTFEEMTDIDHISEVFQGQFWIMLKDYHNYIWVSCKSCQESFVENSGVFEFFVSDFHLNMSHEYLEIGYVRWSFTFWTLELKINFTTFCWTLPFFKFHPVVGQFLWKRAEEDTMGSEVVESTLIVWIIF